MTLCSSPVKHTPLERIAMTVHQSASAKPDWHWSRACEVGACIMVARDKDLVLPGNTTGPGEPASAYTTAEWQQFITGMKQGDFDGIA
jgi:hypothetical protein